MAITFQEYIKMSAKGNKSYRTEIIVAVITTIGVLGGAVFYNWDKIFPPSGSTIEKPEQESEHEQELNTTPPAAPDLIIESLTHSPANPTTTDKITFTAVVKNIGIGKADSSTLALKVGGETSPKTYSISALGPGKTHTVQRRETLSVAQRYRNMATADFKKEIRESNETNNQKTYDYKVGQTDLGP